MELAIQSPPDASHPRTQPNLAIVRIGPWTPVCAALPCDDWIHASPGRGRAVVDVVAQNAYEPAGRRSGLLRHDGDGSDTGPCRQTGRSEWRGGNFSFWSLLS